MSQADFFKKLSKFQETLSSQDWSPDGRNEKQGYAFVSHKKMKRNVSKALLDAGLVWQISFGDVVIGEPIGTMKQHFTVKATARISDMDDPNAFCEYHAFGEAADSGDKALSKAQTSGFKAIINNNFFIADIEADAEEIIENNDSIKAATESGYEARQQIIREKVIRQSATETPAATQPSNNNMGNVSDIQRKVLEKIVSKARVMSESDLLPFGSIDQIEEDYYNIKSADDAQTFITTYTGVLRCP